MRICVYGAGAIGGNLALRLALAGHQVSVVARGEHLAAIRAHGLELRIDIEPTARRARVQASDRPADLGRQEIVLVTLKASALAGIAEDLATLLDDNTAVVFLQNGIPWWYDIDLPAGLPPPPDLELLDPGRRLRRLLGKRHTLGGVAYPSSEVVAPGVVRVLAAGRHDILVGELNDGQSERILALRAALSEAGIPSPPLANLRHAIWNKLLINASVSTLCALVGHPMEILDRDSGLRAVARRGFDEVLSIAAAHGMGFDFTADTVFAVDKRFSGHKPSILQDRERGRPMEITALLDAPLAFATASAVAAPTLHTIASLLKRLQADMTPSPGR